MSWLILILMFGGTLATALVLGSAVRRWRAQIRSGTNGTKLFIARHEVTHQLLRMVKHSLIAYGVGMWLFGFPPAEPGWVQTRNLLMVAVGALMGVASLLEYRFWRKLRGMIRLDLQEQHDTDTDDGNGPERLSNVHRPPVPPRVQA